MTGTHDTTTKPKSLAILPDKLTPQTAPLPPELGPICTADTPDKSAVQSIDRAAKAQLAKLTQGISPFGPASTSFDWGLHLASSPGKQAQLFEKAMKKATQLGMYTARAASGKDPAPCILPLGYDHRFDAPEWQKWPYSLAYQNSLMAQKWWYNATNDIDGLLRHDEQWSCHSLSARSLI